MIKDLPLKPVCYHIPIIVGHSGEYSTFYIIKGYRDFKVPVETEYLRMAEKYEKNESFEKWFVTTNRFEEINKSHCCYKDSDHHWICPLPDMQYGFDTPELALAALEKYFAETKHKYTVIL